MHTQKDATLGPVPTMSLLAFVSGFVDTLSFVGLFGLFAAHITGNLVMMATSVAEFRAGLLIKLLAIPVFIMAAVAARLFIIRRERQALEAAAHVMGFQALLLTVFMVVAVLSSPFKHHEAAGVIATGLLAAASMAVQNTAARTFLAGLPPTTVMTGNLIQVIVDTVDIWHGHGAVDTKRARLRKLVPMLLSFVTGTIFGALGYLTVGFWSLLLPIAMISALSASVRAYTVPV